MLTAKCKNKLPFYLLLLLLVFHTVAHFVFLSLDQIPPVLGSLQNYMQSINLYSKINPQITAESYSGFGDVFFSTTYPPLLYLTANLGFVLFGVSFQVASFSLIVWFWLLLIFFYRLCRLFVSASISFMATFFLSFIPGMYGFMRTFSPNIILTAVVVSSLYYMLLLNKTKKTKHMALSVLFISLGFLSKQAFLLIFFPAVFFLIFTLERKKLIILGILVSVLISFWYVPAFDNMSLYRFALKNTSSFAFFEVNNLKPYFNYLKDVYFFTPALIFFIICLFLFIRKFKNGIDKKTILALAFLPILFFCFGFDFHTAKYIKPVIPAWVLIMACSVDGVFEKQKHKKIMLYCFAFISIMYVLVFVYNLVPHNVQTSTACNLEWIERDEKKGIISPLQSFSDISNMENVLSLADKRPLKAAVLSEGYNGEALCYFLYERHREKHIIKNASVLPKKKKISKKEISEKLDGFDYLILVPDKCFHRKRYPSSPNDAGIRAKYDAVYDYVKANFAYLTAAEIIINGNNHIFDVYKKKKH